MPRPQKKRRVCCLPQNHGFLPANSGERGCVFLQVDEYEAVRLIDYEGRTQGECAEQIDVYKRQQHGSPPPFLHILYMAPAFASPALIVILYY